MDDNRDLISSVKILGYSYENLSESIQAHLNTIHKYREKKLKTIELSEKEMKEKYFSVANIARKIDCSRTTIYNNPVLKDYIDEIGRELDDINPYSKVETLQNEILELNKKIDLMMKRDIELELLRLENIELKEKIDKYEPRNIYSIKQ